MRLPGPGHFLVLRTHPFSHEAGYPRPLRGEEFGGFPLGAPVAVSICAALPREEVGGPVAGLGADWEGPSLSLPGGGRPWGWAHLSHKGLTWLPRLCRTAQEAACAQKAARRAPPGVCWVPHPQPRGGPDSGLGLPCGTADGRVAQGLRGSDACDPAGCSGTGVVRSAAMRCGWVPAGAGVALSLPRFLFYVERQNQTLKNSHQAPPVLLSA